MTSEVSDCCIGADVIDPLLFIERTEPGLVGSCQAGIRTNYISQAVFQ